MGERLTTDGELTRFGRPLGELVGEIYTTDPDLADCVDCAELMGRPHGAAAVGRAYAEGYAEGKGKAHFGVERWRTSEHFRGCGCRLCSVARTVPGRVVGQKSWQQWQRRRNHTVVPIVVCIFSGFYEGVALWNLLKETDQGWGQGPGICSPGAELTGHRGLGCGRLAPVGRVAQPAGMEPIGRCERLRCALGPFWAVGPADGAEPALGQGWRLPGWRAGAEAAQQPAPGAPKSSFRASARIYKESIPGRGTSELSEPEYKDRQKCDEWEVVVPEIVTRPLPQGDQK